MTVERALLQNFQDPREFARMRYIVNMEVKHMHLHVTSWFVITFITKFFFTTFCLLAYWEGGYGGYVM